MDFPAILYRHGSTLLWDGEMFDRLVVENKKEADDALADGWHLGKPPEDVEQKPRRGRPPKDAG